MAKYLRKFETSDAYDAAESTLDKPNVSYIVETNGVEYNPYVPPRPTQIITYEASAKLPEITSQYGGGLLISSFSGVSGQLTITSHTFENGVGTVEFDGDVTEIGFQAFAGCAGLTSITIPDSVTSFGFYVFGECTRLTSITCNATTAPTIDSDTFKNVKTGGTLYVPSGSTGYDKWMRTSNYYLGKYNWRKVEQ